MAYTRAASSDYDDWMTVYGNSGWSSKDLIPLLKKVRVFVSSLSLLIQLQTETYQVKPDAATHGYSGPLKVSYGGLFTNIGQQFLEAAAGYDKERQSTDDVNGLFSCNAYGVCIATQFA
jgi:alcohol oxidase